MSSLVADEEAARHFCRTYLLPYKNPHILQLCARRKYATHTTMPENNKKHDMMMSSSVIILERIDLGFDKGQESEDLFIRELNKMDILANAGFYTERSKKGTSGGVEDDNSRAKILKAEWMVPYITAFGLDEDDAADAFVQKVLDTRKEQRRMLDKKGNQPETKKTRNAPSMTNITSKMRSLLHQHPSTNYRWLKLDVDTKQPDLILELQSCLMGGHILYAAESRGGYHVVLEKGPYCKSLYAFASQLVKKRGTAGGGGSKKDSDDNQLHVAEEEEEWLTIENHKGPLVAIPGTSQGGFIVQNVTEEWRERVKKTDG